MLIIAAKAFGACVVAVALLKADSRLMREPPHHRFVVWGFVSVALLFLAL